MTFMIVTYSGEKTARFDREYYCSRHLPLVKNTWGPYGMEAISAFFPAENTAASGPDTGIIAACLCSFADEDALQAALASPGTPGVMTDLPNFTDLKSVQNQLGEINTENGKR